MNTCKNGHIEIVYEDYRPEEHVPMTTSNCPYCDTVNELADRVAEIAELKSKLDTAMGVIKNDCENEEEAKKEARKVLTEMEVYGDTNAVPSIVDVVETLVRKLKLLRDVVHRINRFHGAHPSIWPLIGIAREGGALDECDTCPSALDGYCGRDDAGLPRTCEHKGETK